MEIDYRQVKTRTTLEKREHWRKKQQLKDLRSEHDKESKQRKVLKLEVRIKIVDLTNYLSSYMITEIYQQINLRYLIFHFLD
jgi:hypothetical protein